MVITFIIGNATWDLSLLWVGRCCFLFSALCSPPCPLSSTFSCSFPIHYFCNLFMICFLKELSFVLECGNTLQYSCLENPHGQRSLVGSSPWGRKELDTTGRLAQRSTLPLLGLSRGLIGKESACSAGEARDGCSVPGLGRSSGKGQGNPLQYSCLEYPVDRGAWWAKVHRVTESRTRLKWLTT